MTTVITKTKTYTIERAQLKALINEVIGIMDERSGVDSTQTLTQDERQRLNMLLASAEAVGVGSFASCPMTLIGGMVTRDLDGEYCVNQRTGAAFNFAALFDLKVAKLLNQRIGPSVIEIID